MMLFYINAVDKRIYYITQSADHSHWVPNTLLGGSPASQLTYNINNGLVELFYLNAQNGVLCHNQQITQDGSNPSGWSGEKVINMDI